MGQTSRQGAFLAVNWGGRPDVFLSGKLSEEEDEHRDPAPADAGQILGACKATCAARVSTSGWVDRTHRVVDIAALRFADEWYRLR
jgi:hypothetical protein